MNAPRREIPDDQRQKIHLDNLFRLTLSLITFLVGVYLWLVHVFTEVRPLVILLVAYTVPYLLIWSLINRVKWLRPLDYLLSIFDIAGITWCIHITGGIQSPFFYLYAIPLLVQAFHF